MSQDIRSDHWKFREINAGYVTRTRKFPSFAKQDWIVQCYDSIKEFEKQYPTSKDRDKLILRMAEITVQAQQQAEEIIKEFFHDDPETGDLLVGGEGEGEEMIRTRWVDNPQKSRFSDFIKYIARFFWRYG